MRVGEAAAPKIRHRVGLAPDHVVQDPEAEVLKDGADAEDVVVAADHPERAFGLQRAAAGGDPAAGEVVIGLEALEPVPIVVDAVDAGVVGAEQLAVQLEIIGRVGEDEVDGGLRQPPDLLDAIADNDLVQRQPRLPRPTPSHVPPDAILKVGPCCPSQGKGGLNRSDMLAAVDGELGAVDVARLLGAEEIDGARDFLGKAEALHGDAGDQLLGARR